MGTIWVDGTTFDVDSSRNLLDVCLNLGFDLPYFCWHPALGSVGACRQCAVKQFKDEEDEKGKLVMACMEPAKDGARISIEDPAARTFRKSVAEWLMVNHPHDCPICDEGGECHLQDMTVMAGHTYRRFRFSKRTYRNQNLGPLINHEMNRCIQCYRCVRFYRDFAGGRDLQAFAAHDHVYFGRHEDGVLESPFSGNLVEVCPTGVFTDKTLKGHYTRKWDLQTAPSVCVHCSLGCNTIPGERYGELRRIRARYNHQVNGYFLCDRGRYGYEFVNHERRLRTALVPQGAGQLAHALTPEDALERLREMVARARGLIGIGSPRASLEGNFALRSLVGPDRFYHGVAEPRHRLVARVVEILRNGPVRAPSLREIENADAVFVLGEDVDNTAPMLALAVRQAVRRQPMAIADKLGIPRWHDAAVREALQNERGPVYVATPAASGLDTIARGTFRAPAEDLARLGFAVAHFLDGDAPVVPGLSDDMKELAEEVGAALANAERPVVISGTGSASTAVLDAAANVAWALTAAGGGKNENAGIFLVVPECNDVGLALMGGDSLEGAVRAVRDGQADTVVILENDLYQHAPRELADELLEGPAHVVVLDHIAHDTAAGAELVLPVTTFAETDGTLINNEGRAQRFYRVFIPEWDAAAAWRWIREAMGAPWKNVDDVTRDLASSIPLLDRVPEVSPPANFRLVGSRVPRQPHRYSGRTAMHAHGNVHEPRPADDIDSPLAFSMEGYQGDVPNQLAARFWAPGWNSIQSLNKFQIEIGGPLRDGAAGLRILEPAPDADWSYITHLPAAFRSKTGQWRVVPLYHVFGSEPLSALAPGIATLTPDPYAALHPDDAAVLGADPGTSVDVEVDGAVCRLPLLLRSDLPRGIVGIPQGLTPLRLDGVSWAAIRPEGAS